MSKLFSPIKIGSMELRNRVIMAPMSSGKQIPDGLIDEDHQEYWLARARGGVGCITVDMVSVDPSVPYVCDNLYFSGEDSIASFKAFTDKVHAAGAKVIPQLAHPGADGMWTGTPAASSSNYINYMGFPAREMTREEIADVVKKFAQTALCVKRAGFDGIQLHCAHAYMLVSSFLSPLYNHRTDEYGGSLDNRARLLFEVIDAIKEICGKDFPLVLRISGSERVPNGLTLDDTLYLVPKMIAHGVDAIEVSGGVQGLQPYNVIPCHSAPVGINLEEAKAIRAISTVPVFVVGKVNDIQKAMHWVDNGFVDGVTMGRAFLADPELVSKAQTGKMEEIAPCTGCAVGCLNQFFTGNPVSCVINPFTGKEAGMKLERTAQPKKVAVIGGGIGGMACARYLTLRGHDVTLFEKSAKLGGQMNLACVAPNKQEMSKWISWLNAELKRLRVKVKLNSPIGKEETASLEADVIVVATGASPAVLSIPGIQDNPVTAHDILAARKFIPGGRILVVGGGIVALEACELMLQTRLGNMEITILEMGDAIGADMPMHNKIPTMNALSSAGVKMLTGTKLSRIDGAHVFAVSGEVEKDLGKFDEIVFSTGTRPDKSISEINTEKEIYVIGDAVEPRFAFDAVREACDIALKI